MDHGDIKPLLIPFSSIYYVILYRGILKIINDLKDKRRIAACFIGHTFPYDFDGTEDICETMNERSFEEASKERKKERKK